MVSTHNGMRRLNTDEYRKSEKARIDVDVEAYLKSGKTITVVPSGVSGQRRSAKGLR